MATPPEPDRAAVRAALILIGALTLWRVAGLWFDGTELSADEAQYWFIGQSPSFGSFSKPPLIGWLIAASTGLFGTSEFGVRVAAPIIHAATAVMVMMLGGRVAGARIGALAGASYATMPAVTLGSALMTTDTPMLLAIATAAWLLHRLAARPSIAGALALGIAVGLGFLAKHAMLYATAGMALAAVVSPQWRLARRDLVVACLTALLTAAPNLWWIASHGFVTVHHMAEDAGAPQLNPTGPLRLLGEQFAVMGPILFAAFLVAAARPAARMRGPVAMAATVLAIVGAQALTGQTLANWAVGFTCAGCVVAAGWLVDRPRLALASLALGAVVAVALPVVTVAGTGWRTGGRLMLARYLGHRDVVSRAVAYASDHGVDAVVAHDRELLADLGWQGRYSGLAVFAKPHGGAPEHQWDLSNPLPPDRAGDLVLLTQRDAPPACARDVARWTAGPGFAEGREMTLSVVTPACLREAADA